MDNLSRMEEPDEPPREEELCPSEGVLFIADKKDCNKYIICAEGSLTYVYSNFIHVLQIISYCE